MKRTCKKCGVEKDIEEFTKASGCKHGRAHTCLECKAKRSREWGQDHREAVNERSKAWQRNHPERMREKLTERHGITQEQYDTMFEAQHGLCAICGKPETRPKSKTNPEPRPLSIDHDHECCPGMFSCGRCIRALLCGDCNTLLGNAHDDIESLVSAIAYLFQPMKVGV